MLKRFGLTEEGFRHKFRNARVDKDETFTQFFRRMSDYSDRWIQLRKSEKTIDDLRDLLLKEQILNTADKDLVFYIKERITQTAQNMVELAELYMEVRKGYSSFQKKDQACIW